MGSGLYPATTGSTMSYAQVENLWITNGGPPGWAPLMAAVAMAESGGKTNILNNTPSTGDYSVGLWQINYYGSLLPGRTATYGAPQTLAGDPNAQAVAAIQLFGNGAGIGNWKGDAAYNAWMAAGAPQQPSAATVASWGVSLGGASSATAMAATSGTTPGQCGGSAGITVAGATIWNGCHTKALVGGLCVGLGGFVLLSGAVLIAAHALSGTKVGRAAEGFATGGPVGAAVGFVAGRQEEKTKALNKQARQGEHPQTEDEADRSGNVARERAGRQAGIQGANVTQRQTPAHRARVAQAAANRDRTGEQPF